MRRRMLSLVASAAAAVLGTSLLVATPAAAAGTGLTGTVTDEAGTPVSTCVSVYDLGYTWVDSACTDDTGTWVLPNLPDGDYKVEVSGTGTLVGEWYDDAVDYDSAAVVTAPGTLASVLAAGGTLSGTLRDATGAPAAWTSVEVTDTTGLTAPNGWTSTAEDGSWSILVPAGSWKVHFLAWPSDQWAHGKRTLDAADVVDVLPGGTVTVDDQLLPVSTITGTVTDTSGSPLENICATLVSPHYDTDSIEYGGACTDATGAYTLYPYGDPGTDAVVLFRDGNEAPVYAAEFSGDTYDLAHATPVDVASDPRVDAVLAVGGTVTGRAVTERRPTGIAGVCPSAWHGRSGGAVLGAGASCSTDDGTYRLTALPPGELTVLLEPGWHSGMASEWYADAETQADATIVPVALGTTTTLKVDKFTPGGTLTGVVTDERGHPVDGAWVYLSGQYPGRAGPGEGRFTARTDATGRYQVVAPAGSYTPLVVPPEESDLAPEWSGDAPTSTEATPVTLRTNRSTTLDVELAPASRITGAVLAADGSTPDPRYYVAGFVYTTSGDYIGDFDAWGDNGFQLRTSSLPAGSFVLRGDVQDTWTSQQVGSVWFDGSTTADQATPVTVGTGQSVSVSFHLAP